MIVEVKQGKLQGTAQKSVLTGNEYYSFLGIPYAKPPLRFQAPVPLEKWDGILDASQEGMPCAQVTLETGTQMGTEDCLFLNVHTPQPPVKITKPKAVMVFIHGGGFASGSGSCDTYPADYLINYDVIYVTLNYRLHALGFLNMGTKNALPNCGLRDQALALKWVKENIGNFGGDSENITIFGESAGASSVHFHTLTPASKGLFHKAILQSGTYNCPWSYTEKPVESGRILANKLGYENEDEDPEKVVEFLKTQSAMRIATAVYNMHEECRRDTPGTKISLHFLPSIEEDKKNAFISDPPEVMMKSATPVPLIVGINNKEGRLAFAALAYNLIETLQKDFTNIVKHDLKCDQERVHTISEKIKEFYLGKKEVGPDTIDAIVDIYTDILFPNFYESFETNAKSNCPAYVYEFCFHGRFNLYTTALMRDPTISFGAAHADELPYLFFKPKHLEAKFEEPELTVIRNMCSMWSNFAKTGNPTQDMKIKWIPSTFEKPCYLRIDEELKMIEGKLTPERIQFWKTFYAL